MVFSLDDGQRAVTDVVAAALGRDALGRDGSWEALVAGGVPALGVPARLGGDGLGVAELAAALTEIGRHGTVGPALATLGLGLIPLLDLASDEQQDRLLADVAAGGVLTAALNEPGAALPERPATHVAGGVLTGTEVSVARATGIGELRFFSKIHHGGGAACATVQQAAMAVATGVAECVVAYRAFNERSGMRFGQVQTRLVDNADSTGVDNSFCYPHGLSTPAAQVAMIARRYMHLAGATSRDFGAVSVADRRHAATNPRAYFYGKPITIDDHQNSRWIAEPLRLLDCCQETDGGVALVITSAERARDLKHRPAVVEAAAQGAGSDQYSMTSYYRPELGLPEMGLVGRQLWEQSGLTPADVQTAVLYDHFTPFTLMQLEELGFCGPGDAKDFVADGAIEIGGRLPVNTHGGQLGEAYVHGMNGIAEGVRQLRGTSVNPVPGVEHVLVTAGTGVPTSGLILG